MHAAAAAAAEKAQAASAPRPEDRRDEEQGEGLPPPHEEENEVEEEGPEGESDRAPLLAGAGAGAVSAAAAAAATAAGMPPGLGATHQQHRRRRPRGEDDGGGGSQHQHQPPHRLSFPRSLSPASSRLAFPAVSRTFPLSASPASRLARRCLLLALLAALLLTLAAPSLLRLPAGRGRGQGAARLAGALRSAREDFGPGEWLALQSGYWQPRDYVKECTPPPPVAAALAGSDMPGVRGLRVFFAANLKDNGPLMAHFTRRLVETVSHFPPGHAFVSIHESNSHDETPQALLALREELQALGVAHRVVVDAPDARLAGEDRIDFLVRMRNKALEPLFGEEESARFDRVVFLNDVFFCPWHVLRLLGHTLEKGDEGAASTALGARFACGLDFKTPSNRDIWWRSLKGLYAGPRFYDIWVARDVRGECFLEDPPFIKAQGGKSGDGGGGADSELATALPLAPFFAYCCWNGLAVLHAAPFFRGVRFRASRPGSPVQSECSLVCDDFWASGYGRVVVDPLVRLAYDARTDLGLHARHDLSTLPASAPIAPAPDAAAGSAASLFPTEPPPAITACYLEPGKDKRNKKVDYSKCGKRPPLEGAVGVDRLCVPLEAEGRQPRQPRGAVAFLLPVAAGAGAKHHEATAAAAARSWQELHPAPRWRVEVVTEQGAKARILQAPTSESSGPLAALLRDTARWGVRRRQDPEGARLALGLGVLLAIGGDEAGEVGVVVAGANAKAAEVSMDCMLSQEEVGSDWLLAIDATGRHTTPMDGGEAAQGGGVIVRDWGAAHQWVEAWVVR